MSTANTVQKIWDLCNVLRGDGISYNQYISELTYLLFLKIAKETGTEKLLPVGYRWDDLLSYKGNNLLGQYQITLTHLGSEATDIVKEIYKFPTTVFSHSENLKVVLDGLNDLDWHSFSKDGIGDIYEGLLSKNSEESRSGAGQYFTPRPLVNTIINVMKPRLGETIQDPAAGTGGFLISADKYLRDNHQKSYAKNPPHYEGMEIEKGTYRLCLMNTFLHGMDANIALGDALTDDANELSTADLIIANPPFGSKSGSVREKREDILFQSSNKQLDFLQHIYNRLKIGGRAAVVLPDNVLFEEGVGKSIREDLMEKCNLHTILRLPTGIFYAQGVQTNVIFFTRGEAKKSNTKNIWVYDLRTNMPTFGKRSPLVEKHFDDFVKAYGNDPSGKSKRIDQGGGSRFRKFTRNDIKNRDDNLDITWLRDKYATIHAELAAPSVIAEQIVGNIRTAHIEIEALQSILNDASDIKK